MDRITQPGGVVTFSLQLNLEWTWTHKQSGNGGRVGVMIVVNSTGYLTTAGPAPDMVNMLVVEADAGLLRQHYILERPAMY